jgi:hypothetical protein
MFLKKKIPILLLCCIVVILGGCTNSHQNSFELLYSEHLNQMTWFLNQWLPPQYDFWNSSLILSASGALWPIVSTTSIAIDREYTTTQSIEKRSGSIEVLQNNQLDPLISYHILEIARNNHALFVKPVFTTGSIDIMWYIHAFAILTGTQWWYIVPQSNIRWLSQSIVRARDFVSWIEQFNIRKVTSESYGWSQVSYDIVLDKSALQKKIIDIYASGRLQKTQLSYLLDQYIDDIEITGSIQKGVNGVDMTLIGRYQTWMYIDISLSKQSIKWSLYMYHTMIGQHILFDCTIVSLNHCDISIRQWSLEILKGTIDQKINKKIDSYDMHINSFWENNNTSFWIDMKLVDTYNPNVVDKIQSSMPK